MKSGKYSLGVKSTLKTLRSGKGNARRWGVCWHFSQAYYCFLQLPTPTSLRNRVLRHAWAHGSSSLLWKYAYYTWFSTFNLQITLTWALLVVNSSGLVYWALPTPEIPTLLRKWEFPMLKRHAKSPIRITIGAIICKRVVILASSAIINDLIVSVFCLTKLESFSKLSFQSLRKCMLSLYYYYYSLSETFLSLLILKSLSHSDGKRRLTRGRLRLGKVGDTISNESSVGCVVKFKSSVLQLVTKSCRIFRARAWFWLEKGKLLTEKVKNFEVTLTRLLGSKAFKFLYSRSSSFNDSIGTLTVMVALTGSNCRSQPGSPKENRDVIRTGKVGDFSSGYFNDISKPLAEFWGIIYRLKICDQDALESLTEASEKAVAGLKSTLGFDISYQPLSNQTFLFWKSHSGLIKSALRRQQCLY